MSSSCWKGRKHINIRSLLITKERGKVFSQDFFPHLLFFIAVPERTGQLFFLQGANFPSAIEGGPRGLQITPGLIKTLIYLKLGKFVKCWY